MANIRLVNQTELQPILDLFADLEWPVPCDQADTILDQLGWERINRSVVRTTLPVSGPLSSMKCLGDEICDVDFWVSDLVDETDHEGIAAIEAGFPVMVDTISACLGFRPTGKLLHLDGVCWDLPTGGRIDLSITSDHGALNLTVQAPRLVALDRADIKYGGSVDDL